jgi:O-antigen/teichoic acid export membrane protein
MTNDLLKKTLRQTQFQQSSLLLLSTIAGMGLSFLNSILVARLLGVAAYGDFKFIQTVWVFISLISSFGFFHAVSRAIVVETDPKTIAEITGASFLITIGISTLMTLASVLLARPLDLIFNIHLSGFFLALSPLLAAYSLQSILPLILQANNRIGLLAMFTTLPQLLNVTITASMLYCGISSIVWVTVAQLGPVLLVGLIVFKWLNPTLENIPASLSKIRKQNKNYGLDIFKGSLGAVGASQINRLTVAYWVDNTALGFLSLAIVLTEPLKLLPNVVATSSFRRFAGQKKISSRIVQISIFISITLGIAAIFFYNNFLHIIYPQGFESVKFMATALSLGAVLHGFGDFYNRFLGAQGEGKSIRNSAYLVGLVSIVAALVLPPILGVWGAVLATLAGNFAYFLLMLASYFKFRQKEI